MRYSMRATPAVVLGTIAVAGMVACSRDAVKGTTTTADTAIPTTGGGAATTAAAPGKPAPVPFLGYRYDPLPAGANYEGGSVMLGADGKPSSFGLSHVLAPGVGNMVWLDSILPDEGKMHSRIVRAVLTIPPVAQGQRFMFGTCDVDGKFDGSVVAIVADERKGDRFPHALKAWRGTPKTSSFDVIPVANIGCDDPDSRNK
jgi:hypothetical protein